MSVPEQWWNVALVVYAVFLFITLLFVWLLFAARGKRSMSIDLSALGINIKIASKEQSAFTPLQ